jgi:RNA polymerase sigma-70 factor, ECF subfamily
LFDEFTKMYNEHVNKVYAYLSIHCSNEDDIRDIIQETFFAVWKVYGDFDGHSKVSTWIIGIARNKLCDHYRRVYQRKAELPVSDGYEYGDALPGEQETDKSDTKITIDKAISRLTIPDKELFFLVFNQGLKYSEAAILLNIPEGTVKSRMSRIRNFFRSQLNETGFNNSMDDGSKRGGKCNLMK